MAKTNKNRWHKLISREGVDATTISGLDVVFYACVRELDKTTPEPFFTILKDRVLSHYLAVDEAEVGRRIYRKFFTSPEKIKAGYKKGVAFLTEAKHRSDYWRKKIAPEASSENFQAAFKEFCAQFRRVNYDFSIWPWWGIESWQIDFEKILRAMVERNNLASAMERLLATVYRPWRKTAIIKLQEDLKAGVSVKKLIERYQFLRSWSAVWYRPINAAWIEDFRAKKSRAKVKPFSRARLMKMLKPTKEEKRFINLAPYIIFFKDWRDDVRRSQVFYWSFLFDALANYFKVERSSLGYLSLDELAAAIKTGEFPADRVNARASRPCVITTADGGLKMRIIDDKKALKKYFEIIKNIEKDSSVGEIKGLAAQTGIAKGKVKIIKTFHDIKRFKAGEILVANTTHPNYLPAMQKAKAFVTNEGGIISHAAIVARELKIPCIVGTKTATKVLRDGDLVEVDANKGIVKILKT